MFLHFNVPAIKKCLYVGLSLQATLGDDDSIYMSLGEIRFSQVFDFWLLKMLFPDLALPQVEMLGTLQTPFMP